MPQSIDGSTDVIYDSVRQNILNDNKTHGHKLELIMGYGLGIPYDRIWDT